MYQTSIVTIFGAQIIRFGYSKINKEKDNEKKKKVYSDIYFYINYLNIINNLFLN